MRVVVLGGGSAGFLTAITLVTEVPDVQVTVLRSPKVPIIGVGEATTWIVPDVLHNLLGIERAPFYRAVRPVWKGGVRLFWGPRDHFDYTFEPQFGYRLDDPALRRNAAFYCRDDLKTASVVRAVLDRGLSPLVPDRSLEGGYRPAGPQGYHIENEPFVAYLAQVAAERGVEVRSAHLERIDRREDGGVARLHVDEAGVGSVAVEGDLYVDASGFRARLLRQELEVPFESFASSLFLDRAVVGGFPRTTEPVRPYTGSHTLDAGWCFVTEHWHKLNVGYVYASAFISDEDAEAELRRFTDHKLESARVIRFASGRAARCAEANVFAIGNAQGFVEPLQSTALHVICNQARSLAAVLIDAPAGRDPLHLEHLNRLFRAEWDQVRRFLAFHYKLNTRLDTPFWRHARAETDLAGAEEVLAVYERCGPTSVFETTLDSARGFFGYDGYLTLLLGMRHPTTHRFEPSARERRAWSEVVREVEAQAATALPLPEAQRIVTRAGWAPSAALATCL